MGCMRRSWAVLVAAALVMPAAAARADVNQQNANVAWRQADQCTRDALKKFPDHTPEANAQRDVARRQCLRNHKLPEPAAAAPPAEESQ
jgi:hypothetical protein